MRTPNVARSYTDRQLAGLERSNFGKWQGTVVKLIAELRAEKRLNAELTRHALRARAQLAALDRPTKPGGRVLLVDVPTAADERCVGETIVYTDPTVDLHMARCPVGVSHPSFDDVVEAVLFGAPRRFRGMPGELTVGIHSLTRYPRDFLREVTSLVDAKLADNVLTALSELRSSLEAEAQKDEGQEQNTIAARAETSTGAPTVPW